MGVNTAYYQILAFVISAAYAGAAGALFAHLNTYISPDIFEFSSTLFVMTMTMVGGMGSLVGSLVGGLALPILQEYLRVIKDWQLVVYGIAIMVVVIIHAGRRDRTYAATGKIAQDSPALVDREDLGTLTTGG